MPKPGPRWSADWINDSEVHVLPIDDNGQHFDNLCPCSPEYEPHGEVALVTHNAFDRRELDEK